MIRADRLILASKSEYRKNLLESCGLKFKALSSNVDESRIQHKDVKLLALKRAEAKAVNISEQNRDCIVIGCDQTLDIMEKAIHKAKTEQEALLSYRAYHHPNISCTRLLF